MKRIFLIISILFLLIGCNKEEEISLEEQIIGKWQLIEEHTSKNTSDDTIQWVAVVDGQIQVFEKDFTYLNSLCQSVGTYSFHYFKGQLPFIDMKLPCLFLDERGTVKGSLGGLQIRINGNEMIFSDQQDVCSYGCSFKYRRVD
jgi:hypothetical protein